MSLHDAIAHREVGQYPISIATSLALESALGVHPDIVVAKPPLLEFDELWINVRTLYRNLAGALDSDSQKMLFPTPMMEGLKEEMEAIQSLIPIETDAKVEVVFYLSNYKDIERKYANKVATVRRDNTDRQKAYTEIQNKTLGLLLKQMPGEIEVFDLKLKPPPNVKAMIITHYAYDLLSWRDFKELVLLESHTGAVKERAQWHTKYHDGKALTNIPFREDFLQVFGDNETFKPADHRLRAELLEIAKKYNWTPVSTREKLIYGIDSMNNHFHREILKSIMVP